MNAADFAAQSDPDLNRHFRRRWEDTAPARQPVQDAPRTLEQLSAELVLAWRSGQR